MKILLLSDGIPGHVNQARGLVNLFKKHNNDIECTEQVIKLQYKWMRPLLKKLLNSNKKLAIRFTCLAYQLNMTLIEGDYNLILSAGGNTSYINAVISKKLLIKNIFIGSLRNLDSKLFNANLTLEKTLNKNNVVMQIAPCLTTSKSTIEASRKFFNTENSDSIWLMIIGGNGAGCIFSQADWTSLVENMVLLSKQYKIKWLLTTSRRTGLENEKILKNIIPNKVIEEAVWYNHSPQKVMQAYLGMASKVFCTVDSMSMISEAISSCTETIALIPSQQKMTDRYQNALSRLAEKDLLKLTLIADWKDHMADSGNTKDSQYLNHKIAENEDNILLELNKRGIDC